MQHERVAKAECWGKEATHKKEITLIYPYEIPEQGRLIYGVQWQIHGCPMQGGRKGRPGRDWPQRAMKNLLGKRNVLYLNWQA